MHKYLYAGNNPVDNIDPLGRDYDETIRLYQFVVSPPIIRGLHVAAAAISCALIWEGSKTAAYEKAGAFGTVEMVAPCYWKATKPVVLPIPIAIAGTPASPMPPRCKELGDAVQAAKGVVGGLGGCTQGMSQWQLKIRYDAWVDLGQKRGQYDQVCWNGGDEGHQIAEAQAWEAVANCSQLLGELP